MPRKDPMTGCLVMTLPEFLNAEAEREGKGRTGGDILQDIYSEMAGEDERISAEMAKPESALKTIQDAIKESREYCDEEYAESVPEIVQVVNVIEAKYSGSFKSHSTSLKAEALSDAGKLYYVWSWSSEYYGSMWEPPDGDGNICIGEFRPMIEHPWKCYECGETRKTGARNWAHIRQSNNPKMAVHSCPRCNGYENEKRKRRLNCGPCA